MNLKITESSGDVFRDLGFDAKESEELGLRSDLIAQVRKRIADRIAQGDTQKTIARLLEVSQPRISDLTRGKIHLFSVETLATMLRRLGAEVAVSVVTPRPDQGIYVANTQIAQVLTESVAATNWVFSCETSKAVTGMTWSISPVDLEPFVKYVLASTTKPEGANTQLAVAA